MSDYWVIAIDGARPIELQAVQAIVTAHSDEWWHQFETLWIVKGHTAPYWRTLVRPVLAANPRSGVLVFGLPPEGAETMSYFGPGYRAKMAWLARIFRTPKLLRAKATQRPPST